MLLHFGIFKHFRILWFAINFGNNHTWQRNALSEVSKIIATNLLSTKMNASNIHLHKYIIISRFIYYFE